MFFLPIMTIFFFNECSRYFFSKEKKKRDEVKEKIREK